MNEDIVTIAYLRSRKYFVILENTLILGDLRRVGLFNSHDEAKAWAIEHADHPKAWQILPIHDVSIYETIINEEFQTRTRNLELHKPPPPNPGDMLVDIPDGRRPV